MSIDMIEPDLNLDVISAKPGTAWVPSAPDGFRLGILNLICTVYLFQPTTRSNSIISLHYYSLMESNMQKAIT